MQYFMTERRIKSCTTILGNVDADLITPLIPTVADQFIKTRTGSHFFDYLLKQYQTSCASGYHKEVIKLIQQAMTWRIASEVTLTSSSQVSNKGPQDQFGDNSTSSSISKVGMLTKHYNGKADFYETRLVKYLWNNAEHLPEFTSPENNDCASDIRPSKSTSYNDIHFF